MNINFEFSDFIDNVNFNNTRSILDDIKYLVKRISTLEKKCKNVITDIREEFSEKFTEEYNTEKETKNNKNKSNETNVNTGLTIYEDKLIKSKDISNNDISIEYQQKTEDKQNSEYKQNKKQEENIRGDYEDENENNEDKNGEKDDNNLEPVLKKLIDKMYKKIALKYHPDKCGNKYSSIFISAKHAAEENNLTKLLYIFALQEIKMEFTEEDILYIEKVKSQLERKMISMSMSPLTKWEHLPDFIKQRIAKKLCKMR
jgi:hypothetical protein